MKKVLFIPEFIEPGGAMTYALEVLNYYAEAGYAVSVCLPLESQFPEVMRVIKALNIKCFTINKRWKGFKNFWRISPFNYVLDFILIFKIYQKTKPDLLMVSSIYPESFLGLAMLPKPFIGIIHTYHMFNRPIFERWPYFQHTHNLLNNFILNKALNGPNKKMIAVSEFTKSQLLKSFIIPSDTFSLIYNFGIKSFNNSCKQIKDNKFRILTLGHVREYKNPFLWIKVAEKVIYSLPEREIEFIWGGDGELLEDCKQIVIESKLENRIRFIGHVGNVAENYSMASLYFQPSLIESHGIAVVEAMAYSLPCVVANIGGLPESVEQGFNGYIVPPHDTDEMSNAIISIISNPKLCIELGENSLQVYRKKFSFEIWKEKMDSLHINVHSISNYRK